MKPIERMVMHAGKASGMSLDLVNVLLVGSGLKPVTDGNWNFIQRYVPAVQQDPKTLAKLAFGSIPLASLKPEARRKKFRVINGGRSPARKAG
jgi:hypothetical protein